MAKIVSSEKIAQGVTLDGRTINVFAHHHDEDIRGVGRDSVSVDLGANGSVGPSVFGFRNADDALRFLTTPGNVEIQEPDQSGNLVNVTRQGLGVPAGMVARFDEAKAAVPSEEGGQSNPPTEVAQ